MHGRLSLVALRMCYGDLRHHLSTSQAWEKKKEISIYFVRVPSLICFVFHIYMRFIRVRYLSTPAIYKEESGGGQILSRTSFFGHFFPFLLLLSLNIIWCEIFNAAVNLIWIFSLGIAYFWYPLPWWYACNMYSARGPRLLEKKSTSRGHQITFAATALHDITMSRGWWWEQPWTMNNKNANRKQTAWNSVLCAISQFIWFAKIFCKNWSGINTFVWMVWALKQKIAKREGDSKLARTLNDWIRK